MKKIILCSLLFILSMSNGYANTTREIENYLSSNLNLSQEIGKIDIQIISFDGEEYKKYELFINKTFLQIQVKENEKTIFCLEEGIRCYDYAGNRLSVEQGTQMRIYDQELSNLENIKKAYTEKYEILKGEYDSKVEEMKLLEEQEKLLEEQKLRAEKELKLQQEREEKAKEYFLSARRKLDDGDIKSAISSYVYSCSNSPNYECYFELGNAYFLQSQSYYEKINSYGYDKLFKEQKEKAVESLGKAYNLAEDDTQRESINSFIGQIENYPNKEEKEPIKNTEENTINAKVEIIWSRIEKLTSEYSEEKKRGVYKALAIKFKEYRNKISKQDMLELIDILINKLETY